MASPSIQSQSPKKYFVPNEIGYSVVQNNNKTMVSDLATLQKIISSFISSIDDADEKGMLNAAFDNSAYKPRISAWLGFSVVCTRLLNTITDTTLLKLIAKLNEMGKSGAGYTVKALPNWLAGAQQGSGMGTGGPGGLPVLAKMGQMRNFSPNTTNELGVVIETPEKDPSSSISQVNVYILDTVPDANLVETKRGQYDDNALGNPPPAHELINSLFGDSSYLPLNGEPFPYSIVRVWQDKSTSFEQFSIYYDETPDATQKDIYVPPHHYAMPDHGLFIASLIAQQYPIFYTSISGGTDFPPLKIHLIQVLNEYGVGTMDCFLRGLAKVAELQNLEANVGNPAIVNCSWVLAAPTQLEQVWHLFDNTAGLSELESYLVCEIANAKSQDLKGTHYTEYVSFLEGILALHDQFVYLSNTYHTSLLACAGNDGNGNLQWRPSARFPAAYKEVVGVTALQERNLDVPASYANIADDPSDVGFAIWGGEIVPSNGDYQGEPTFFSDAGNSPVGLYFNESFPDESTAMTIPNDNGIAHWSGTSFATPLMTATFAAKMAATGMGDFANTKAELTAASQALGDPTNKGERTIFL